MLVGRRSGMPPYEECDFILVTQVRAVVRCILILFITQSGSEKILSRIFSAGFSSLRTRRGSHFGIAVPVQTFRRIFSFIPKAAQPRFSLVSGPSWSEFDSGLGAGLGLWVGSGLRPYLDPTRTMQYVKSLPFTVLTSRL